MKTKKILKMVILPMALAANIAPFLLSCNNDKGAADTKKEAEEHNDAKFETNDKEKDAEFLVKAAEINLAEIKLGELAEQKGGVAYVKDMGKMMKDQHTKTMHELESLAAKKMITVPTSITDKGQDEYNKLMEKSGNDFDKAYCDMMVDGHKDAISKFEKASAESKDDDIRNWASSTLTILRGHLDHAIDCQKKCEKM